MQLISDHTQEALGRLLEQYKDLPLYAGLVTAIAGEVQALENALGGMIADDVLGNATGAQLDGFGAIVGQAREGMADEQYRLYIQVRQLIDRSSGTPDEILAIFTLLLQGNGAELTLTEWEPAAIILQQSGVPCTTPSDFLAILQEAKDAGVKAQFAWQGVPDAELFCFFGGDGLGFATSTTPGSGGNFAEIEE